MLSVVVRVWTHALGSLHLRFLCSEVTGLDPQAVTVGQRGALQALTWPGLSPAIPCFTTLSSHAAKDSSHINDFWGSREPVSS